MSKLHSSSKRLELVHETPFEHTAALEHYYADISRPRSRCWPRQAIRSLLAILLLVSICAWSPSYSVLQAAAHFIRHVAAYIVSVFHSAKHDDSFGMPSFWWPTDVISSSDYSPLAPFVFQPLPLGSIKPLGWMKDQLDLMSNGLAGHQYDFYHIVKYSPWIGGHSEYSVLNEGLPYWFNGLVPLAYSLNDTRLIQQVQDASDLVLNHQQEDGWLGPELWWDRDLWARFPFCLGLIQLAEADEDRATKVIPALYRFVNLMHVMLIENWGFDQIWGRVRFPDMMITLQWLYEHYPDGNEALLLETMHLLKYRSLDWAEFWSRDNYIFEDLDLVQPPITDQSAVFPFVHGVNAVQGLKAGGVLNRFMYDEGFNELSRKAVNWTLTYHGDPAGSVVGDERESGMGSNRGTELCTTVELMYSLSYLYQTIGDNRFADQCELAAFNALPVSLTSDHWKRQYIAVPNEPFADAIYGPNPFWNVGVDGLVFSLERNYPCCTVNMPQGLPKFLTASFTHVGDNGIAHALLGPAEVFTTTGSGTIVTISCNTTYPFGSTLHYSINASAPFALFLRVPSWHVPSGSFIDINNSGAEYPLDPDPRTGMTQILLQAGLNTVTYNLDASVRVEERTNGSISIYHGALLYALDIGQDIANLPVHLYNESFTYPTADGPPDIPSHIQDIAYTNVKPWNMAVDPSTLEFHASSDGHPIQKLENPIFDYEAPPSYITAKGCQIRWEMFNGLPAALPKLPEGAVWQCISNVTDLVFRPYGSLKIHMAELPTVDLQQSNTTVQRTARRRPPPLMWAGEI